jgi:hypothetical protein
MTTRLFPRTRSRGIALEKTDKPVSLVCQFVTRLCDRQSLAVGTSEKQLLHLLLISCLIYRSYRRSFAKIKPSLTSFRYPNISIFGGAWRRRKRLFIRTEADSLSTCRDQIGLLYRGLNLSYHLVVGFECCMSPFKFRLHWNVYLHWFRLSHLISSRHHASLK